TPASRIGRESPCALYDPCGEPMTSTEKLVLPADLQSALRAAAGAREAFQRLTPSHRRELLRYINATRSAASRKKRIGEAIDQALGRTPEKNRGQTGKPLWICPECGNPFVNRNQW